MTPTTRRLAAVGLGAILGLAATSGATTAEERGPAGRGATTTSAFASITRSPAFPIPAGSGTVMFSLTRFADESTGALRVRGPARLTATASLELRWFGIDTASCLLQAKAGGPWRALGPVAVENGFGSDIRTVTLTGGADVGRGPVDARVLCSSAVNDLRIAGGSLTIVATPR